MGTIARKLEPGFSGTIKNGKFSDILEEMSPMGCKDCTIRNCPYRVKEGNSICAMQERWVALGRLLGDVYDRQSLARYVGAVIQIQSFRFSKAAYEERLEGLGVDPEVTKLGREIVQEARALAEIQGIIKGGTSVVVDQRQVHLHQEIRKELDQMPESEYVELLEAFAQMREVNEKVAMQLMAGASLEEMIDKEVAHEREREEARPREQQDRRSRARQLRSAQED